MALGCLTLLKSPKFLCKYVQICAPSAVVCYVHSQLSVQPCKDVQRCASCFEKTRNNLKTMPAAVRNREHGIIHTGFCHMSEENNTAFKGTNAVSGKPGNACSFGKTAFDITEFYQKAMDPSFLEKWNNDPLLDNKEVVLMVFKSDNLTGRLCFEHAHNFRDALSRKPTPLDKMPSSQLKCGHTRLETSGKSLKKASEDMTKCQPTEKIDVACKTSSSTWPCHSISEAAILFTNFCSHSEKPKKVTRDGPDATQLSSVLLKLRDEIPEFFLKKPNYDIYHKRVKFVNNITKTTTHGIYPYRVQISGGRLMLLSYMTDLTVEVLKITKHPNEGEIKVRWRVKGVPLIRKFVPYVGRKVKSGTDAYRYLDGFSVFEVGKDGLIHCHRLHKVMPSSSHERDNPLWMLGYFSLLRLLNPRPSESIGAFDCWSTSEGLDAEQESDALPC